LAICLRLLDGQFDRKRVDEIRCHLIHVGIAGS